uniref:Putative extracellular matrix protein n=1 Tax=uncultured Myxococcales bacterium TaxID=253830 RepID=G3D5H9_9BACT|nr:putative extracellular matrix protein [uncultured Myxococcales bacterium]
MTCDDANPCTDDSCGPSGACEYVNNEALCDDRSACTEQDRCANGICTGVPITCFDDNPCTMDHCVAETGCVFTDVAVPCDDGDLCTAQDMCIGGVCTPGALLDCDDLSSCTGDVCESEVGCVYTYLCDAHATCLAAACECDPGYEGDGYSCVEAHTCGDGVCSSRENVTECPQDCDHDLVVIVEEAIADLVAPGLQLYLHDLDNIGYLARVEPWTPGTAEELKSLLYSQIDRYDIEGALLVGNLPAAWYEQELLCWQWDMTQTPPVCLQRYHEEFPSDLILQDRDAVWGDADEDGIYDSHSPLELDIFVSRLQTLPDPAKCIKTESFPACIDGPYDPGNPFYMSDECMRRCPSRLAKQSWGPVESDVECCGPYFINRYFERAHDYRTRGSLVASSALLFLDDDWAHMTDHDLFGLGSMYSSVSVIAEPVDRSPGVIHTTTQIDEYTGFLTETGAEFVYQMIHSGTQNLYFHTCGEWTDDCFESEPTPWPECYSSCTQDADCCACSPDDQDTCHCTSFYCAADGVCQAPARCKWRFSDPIHRTSIGPKPDLGPYIPIELGQLHYDLKCSFLNMYDCQAARFTVPNLAMAFTVQASYGLATVGSTKVGGMYDGTPFHQNLATGTSWGEAFRLWYNDVGSQGDLFTIGMGIMGDPLLTVPQASAELLMEVESGFTSADLERLEHLEWSDLDEVDTFEDYKKTNPQFFR